MLNRAVSKLLWFHAFRRSTVGDVIDVLRRGPSNNPDTTCRTRQNEAVLGLRTSVYAYLGKTIPHFGDAAFALPIDALAGEMSPFDSGGLVQHIKPVSERDDSEKRAFVSAFTFDTRWRKKLLSEYPGVARAAVRTYLEGKRPKEHDGPHTVWPSAAVTDPEVAAIWHSGNGWRAWTWEGRVPRRLPVDGNIVQWSCTPMMYQRIREYAETEARPADASFLNPLLRSYVRGGVSKLVSSLREGQLP